MRIIPLNPVPPPDLSEAEKAAWLRGWHDGAAEGEDSLEVITPYDVDRESALYEAWEAGADARQGF